MIIIIIKILATATLISDIFILVALLYFILRLFYKVGWLEIVLDFFSKYVLVFAFIVALTATTGSLFFSEIAGLVPCKLCWFQRIFMYPQALILGIALFYKDLNIKKYIMPMCAIGGSISVYNYYFQLFPPAVNSCSLNDLESCSQKIFMHYGYITIAIMALTASLLIYILMANFADRQNKQ
jgi:disulfide bond formation protein DsbB